MNLSERVAHLISLPPGEDFRRAFEVLLAEAEKEGNRAELFALLGERQQVKGIPILPARGGASEEALVHALADLIMAQCMTTGDEKPRGRDE